MLERVDSFTKGLVIVLALIGLFLLLQPAPTVIEGDAEYTFFFLPSCSHCHEQMEFHKDLSREFPDLEIDSVDVSTAAGRSLYVERVGSDVRVPVTLIGNSTIRGFGSADTTGVEIREALRGAVVVSDDEDFEVWGRSADSFSLPVLALVLGLLDGFNPCAMWMLVYLLGLVATLPNRRRRWLIISVFLFASAVLYFLFMTAWLSAFLVVGVLRPVQIFIALFAVGVGVSHVRDWYLGDVACKVDPKRAKRYEKAKELVARPLSWAVFAGIVFLAFAVNSVEFLCSASIPAVFTGVLALSEASLLYQYALIGLYVLMYMIDDLVIVLLAMFAINRWVSDAYMRHTKIVTGVLLLVLGLLLIFAPDLLF